MDILLEHGAARAFPDDVYVASRHQIERVLPTLRAAGVEFQLNDTLAGARLTLEEKHHLAERAGWYRPDQQGSAEHSETRSS
jgi:hypothetical protein